MKSFTTIATALLALTYLSSGTAAHQKRTGHSHHHHKKSPSVAHLEKRTTTCAFPTDAGLVSVTPDASNAGWAMSPDQPCTAGMYCPYACPAGQVAMQWDPTATSYTYPASMNGGLYCNDDGTVSKPFPDRNYCVDGVGSVKAVDNIGSGLAVCQTVLPGNEAMLIPTDVSAGGSATLAVPDTSFWAGTASHFYINPPGVSTTDGCIWGTSALPHGNWAPYVAGANADASGNTYVKIAWNPIYTEDSYWITQDPGFGVKITCEGEGCNGLPCECNPAKYGINGCSDGSTAGVGGAQFCVVTVPSGGVANIEVFDTSGTYSSSFLAASSASSSDDVSSSTEAATTSSVAESTSTTESSTSTTESSTSTTESSTSTTTTSSTTTSFSSSSSTTSTTSSSSSKPPTSTFSPRASTRTRTRTTSTPLSASPTSTSSMLLPTMMIKPHVAYSASASSAIQTSSTVVVASASASSGTEEAQASTTVFRAAAAFDALEGSSTSSETTSGGERGLVRGGAMMVVAVLGAVAVLV
ncbi:hypothetical protein YB2330_004437 [Saitoella coloradoensis]